MTASNRSHSWINTSLKQTTVGFMERWFYLIMILLVKCKQTMKVSVWCQHKATKTCFLFKKNMASLCFFCLHTYWQLDWQQRLFKLPGFSHSWWWRPCNDMSIHIHIHRVCVCAQTVLNWCLNPLFSNCSLSRHSLCKGAEVTQCDASPAN